MNERIRQLAEQATTYIEPTYSSGEGWIFDKEKFAELIVEECILTIQMGITRDGHDTEQYQRSIKHIKQIKEHFGFEETRSQQMKNAGFTTRPKGWTKEEE
jgi:hypothetical protein